MVWLGLESWSTRLNCSLGVITRGVSLGQVRLGQGTRPTGQAVRVMVWLGLESWSTRLNCSLGVITCGVSLGQVRLGQGTRPTGQAVRVMVWLGLESWSIRLNCSLGVITHAESTILEAPGHHFGCLAMASLYLVQCCRGEILQAVSQCPICR